MKRNTIDDCLLVKISKIKNEAGNLAVLENQNNIPFDVKRIYFLYDVPSGAERGGHAHKRLKQYIVATNGSFDVIIDDGKNKKRIFLNSPDIALYVVPGMWRQLDNFSSGSVSMVLASELYDEDDYIRDYSDFKKYINEKH